MASGKSPSVGVVRAGARAGISAGGGEGGFHHHLQALLALEFIQVEPVGQLRAAQTQQAQAGSESPTPLADPDYYQPS